MDIALQTKKRAAGASSILASLALPAMSATKAVAVGAGISGGLCAAGGVLLVGGALTADPFMAIAGGLLMTSCKD